MNQTEGKAKVIAAEKFLEEHPFWEGGGVA